MTYAATRRACWTGYVTQAVVNNLAPLLFIVFQTDYRVPIEALGRLVLLNFATQLLTDLFAVRYADRLGYRGPLVAAHALAALGLVLLGVLPGLLASPYLGLCIAVVVYAVGGGLLEVLISPVIDALPGQEEGKAAAMSLLHSFYCWGQVAVVAGSTALLAVVGFDRWAILPVCWAAIPAVNMAVLTRVPMPDTVPADRRTPLASLIRSPAFVCAVVLMACAGASELTMSQWSSLFAEQGLGVTKVLGDLAGPCLFAVLMGIGRTIYGLQGRRIPLTGAIIGCGTLATACYLTAALAADARWALVGCALCGLAVSLLWPGTFSLAARRFPLGGAAMFGVLAVAGDAGGALGPWAAGSLAQGTAGTGWLHTLSQALPDDGASGLRTALLLCTLLPLTVVVAGCVWAGLARRSPAPTSGSTADDAPAPAG